MTKNRVRFLVRGTRQFKMLIPPGAICGPGATGFIV